MGLVTQPQAEFPAGSTALFRNREKREGLTERKGPLALRYTATGGAFSGKERLRTVSRKQFFRGGPVSYSAVTSAV